MEIILVIPSQPPLEPSLVVLRRRSSATHIMGWHEEAMAPCCCLKEMHDE